MMVPVVCMGYKREDGSIFICPTDMGTKEIEGAGATHGCCEDCTAENMAIIQRYLASLKK